jgi:hypothetical protein
MEGKEDKKRIKSDRRYEGERNIEKEEREGRKGKDLTKNKEYKQKGNRRIHIEKRDGRYPGGRFHEWFPVFKCISI